MDLPKQLGNTSDIELTRIEENASAVIAYERMLVAMVREIRKAVKAEVLPYYTSTTLDSQSNDAINRFTVVKQGIGFYVEQTEDKFARLVTDEDGAHKNKVIKVLQNKTGVDVSEALELDQQGIDDLIRLNINRNAALIKSLADDTIHKVEQAIFQAKIDRTTYKELTKILAKKYISSAKRAALIARDQLASINADFTRLRHEAIGIKQYRWRKSGRPNVRQLHLDINGRVYTWGKPTDAEEGLPPGKPINCFTGDSKVDSHSLINRVYRRRYTDELVTVTTLSGKVLKSTPNHPHLTSVGWVPACQLNVGDDLIKVLDHGGFTLNADTKNGVTRFGDLFNSLHLIFGSESTNGLSADFHGDGCVDHDVNVIDIEGKLRHAIETLASQGVDKFRLAVTDVDTERFLSAYRAVNGMLFADRFTSHSCVSTFGQLFSIIFTESGHADSVRFRAATDFFTLALKTCGNSGPCQSVSLSKGAHAIAAHVIANKAFYVNFYRIWWRSVMAAHSVPSGSHSLAESIGIEPNALGNFTEVHSIDVEPDAIADITVGDSSHDFVFNLETELGLYSVDNVITRNCRCTAVPIIPANPAAVRRQEKAKRKLIETNTKAREAAKKRAAKKRAAKKRAAARRRGN